MTAHQRLPLFEFFLLHTSHLDHEIGPEHPTREFSDEQAYRTTWKGLELGLSKLCQKCCGHHLASFSVTVGHRSLSTYTPPRASQSQRWPQVVVHDRESQSQHWKFPFFFFMPVSQTAMFV
jgi:hypothetical protein